MLIMSLERIDLAHPAGLDIQRHHLAAAVNQGFQILAGRLPRARLFVNQFANDQARPIGIYRQVREQPMHEQGEALPGSGCDQGVGHEFAQPAQRQFHYLVVEIRLRTEVIEREGLVNSGPRRDALGAGSAEPALGKLFFSGLKDRLAGGGRNRPLPAAPKLRSWSAGGHTIPFHPVIP